MFLFVFFLFILNIICSSIHNEIINFVYPICEYATKVSQGRFSCTLLKQVLRLGRLPGAERSRRGWCRTQVELAAESSPRTPSVVAVHVSHSKRWLTVASPARRRLPGWKRGTQSCLTLSLLRALNPLGFVFLKVWSFSNPIQLRSTVPAAQNTLPPP